MNIKESITNLNNRANKLWDTGTDNVVAVCIFVAEDGKFVQSWFANWNLKGHLPSSYDGFISEAHSIESSLNVLSNYLERQELAAMLYHQEGDKIANETGFGD